MDWNSALRRAEGIEIREVTDGFVVYDPRRDRLHYLNLTAVMLLECCDGATPASELASMLAQLYRLDAPPVDEVEQCLEKLLAESLLVESGEPGLPAAGAP